MEIPLEGGYLSSPVRIGETVRRTPSSQSRHTLELLARVGFTAAPRWLGVDNRGRDTLTYIEGEHRTGAVKEPALLREVFALIRALHDVTERPDGTVLRHGDLSPRNTIFRKGRPVAFIDWDGAAYGSAVHDVAFASWQFLGLGPGCKVAETRSELTYVCECYGSIRCNAAFIDEIAAQVDQVHDQTKATAAAGDVRYRHLVDIGALSDLASVSTWLRTYRDELAGP